MDKIKTKKTGSFVKIPDSLSVKDFYSKIWEFTKENTAAD
jgi:hypothetical protein